MATESSYQVDSEHYDVNANPDINEDSEDANIAEANSSCHIR